LEATLRATVGRDVVMGGVCGVLYLKACPRCGGDVYLGRDSWGAYLVCLQCGRARDIPSERPAAESREESQPDRAGPSQAARVA